MIGWQEILGFACEVELDPNVVEKEYVLGWMLAGIAIRMTLKTLES